MGNSVLDLCEICGKSEKGYSAKLSNVAHITKGPARHKVYAILCSKCLQGLINKQTSPDKNGATSEK